MAINKTTTAVRTGIDTDRQYGSVTPPLYLSSNFSFEDFAQPRQYDYTRSGNPTRDQLGKALAKLEGGYDGVITSSGMSAIYLVTHLLDKAVATRHKLKYQPLAAPIFPQGNQPVCTFSRRSGFGCKSPEYSP